MYNKHTTDLSKKLEQMPRQFFEEAKILETQIKDLPIAKQNIPIALMIKVNQLPRHFFEEAKKLSYPATDI